MANSSLRFMLIELAQTDNQPRGVRRHAAVAQQHHNLSTGTKPQFVS